MRGRFITIEGPDGCGKTTQTELLVKALREEGRGVIVTREPGGTRVGEEIRSLVLSAKFKEMRPLTELLLMSASRSQHVLEKIAPALKEGKIIVCSRFTDATIAYQGYGRGFDIPLIEKVNVIATTGVWPDLTIILDIDVREGLRRAIKTDKAEARSGEGDRLESEEIGFHERVRAGYLEVAKKYPARVKVIDASGTIEEVRAAVMKEVRASLDG
jgi:dTMP kinase